MASTHVLNVRQNNRCRKTKTGASFGHLFHAGIPSSCQNKLIDVLSSQSSDHQTTRFLLNIASIFGPGRVHTVGTCLSVIRREGLSRFTISTANNDDTMFVTACS
jgi:hypothetical protein